MHRRRGFDMQSALIGAALAMGALWLREAARPTANALADTSSANDDRRQLARLIEQTNIRLDDTIEVLKQIRDQQHGAPGFEPGRR